MDEFSDLSKLPSDAATKTFGDSPIAEGAKYAVTEMKTAFGSPQPDAEPAPPAPAADATPTVNPKQLDFDVGGATPTTPVMTTGLTSSSDDEIDYNTFITETILWTNKIRSTFYFIAGLRAWFVVRGIFTSNMTLFTGVCYTLLFSLAFNFFRGVMAPKFQERCKWSHSSWTRFLTSAAATSISAAAALHDGHLNGLDPTHTLEVGLSLWILSVLGRALDAVTLLLLIHLGLFTVPLAYKLNKAKVDKALADVYGMAQAQYDKLDRRVKAAVVLGPMFVLFFLLPALDRFVAIFVVLAYSRAILKPNEFAAVQKRVEPVTNMVQNVGTQAAGIAVNTAKKYDLTPTPRKKKLT